MGLKKYEIITVGGDKRVRALRSWAVGGRYVNIGDVGGIVYDEKTLSQDGLCWLFRGNFGFPGARIGGDSIVDVAEAALSAAGAPNVDILGSSAVVGSKLQFEAEQTAADAVVLTAADFEQGGFNAPIAGNPLTGSNSDTYIRTKNPIFAGGKTVTLKCEVPGYTITAVAVDRDGLVITSALATATGAGVTITVPAGQYFSLTMTKDLTGPTVPADATAAAITFTGTYETKLSIIDSRVEINPANATGTATIKPGGVYTIASGAKYPDCVIQNSKVSMMVHATANRAFRIMGQIIGSTATLDGATAGGVTTFGLYSNVKNLMISGILSITLDARAYSLIQANDCNDFAVSPAIFPGRAAAQTANMPFIFRGCNVPDGRFYHHAQIANTYKNIDFALAQSDLDKAIASGEILVSSEVEGMYRAYSVSGTAFGGLVEGYGSVKSLNMAGTASSYGTTIYKDAYINGLFDIAGTNVFGNTKKHNTQDVSGCKIVNTDETAVNMKGNIRVEGNATLTNCSIVGSGYFGGNAVASGLIVNGCAYMSDNSSFTKTAGSQAIRNLKMTENAYAVMGGFSLNGRIHLSDNARFIPRSAELYEGDIIMKDNAVVSENAAVIIGGVLVMKDNANVRARASLSAYGDITICGSYNQTVNKVWTGKRVIDSVDAPAYDNNVKTQYDF